VRAEAEPGRPSGHSGHPCHPSVVILLGWRRESQLPGPAEGVRGSLQPLHNHSYCLLCHFNRGVEGLEKKHGDRGLELEPVSL